MKTNHDSRHFLRQRAFQAVLSLEYGQDPVQAAQFAYCYDKDEEETVEIPLFLLQLVQGVADHKEALDQAIALKLKTGWTMERLTLVDKSLLRLGLYEIQYYEETPERVAVNEAIEIAKEFTEANSVKFINGILSSFITE